MMPINKRDIVKCVLLCVFSLLCRYCCIVDNWQILHQTDLLKTGPCVIQIPCPKKISWMSLLVSSYPLFDRISMPFATCLCFWTSLLNIQKIERSCLAWANWRDVYMICVIYSVHRKAHELVHISRWLPVRRCNRSTKFISQRPFMTLPKYLRCVMT